MIDKKLLGDLKKNAGAILDIMERNGVDVSKYRKLAEEQKEKERNNKAKAKIYRQNYKASTTAFLNRFAYSEIRAEKKQYNKDNMQILKDCLLLADERTDELQDFLRVASTIKAGKKPYYKKVQPQQLKSLNKPSILLERAKQNQEKRINEAKASFIKYYCDNWFFILLDLMKNQPREKRSNKQ